MDSNQNRPRGLAETALLMCVTNAMGWALVDWTKPHTREQFIIFTFLILVGYVFIWFYWTGRNWARIAVLLTSVLSISNVRFWSHYTAIGRGMIASEAILGVFLLYWMNTAAVKAFFRKTQSVKA
jgi:hypothetical protein